jgi:flagellar motility protein MotE (MotC chaperone)
VKSLRLLPVVIFAAMALLLFKGIGLVTMGGYVLSGPAPVAAEEATAEDTSAGSTLPSEAMLTDASPTLADTAPTLVNKPEPPAGHGGEGESAPAASTAASAPGSAASTTSAAEGDAVTCPDTGTSRDVEAPAGTHQELTERIGKALAKGCPSVQIPLNAHGDALPTTKDGNGVIVPLQVAEGGGDDSEPALLQRLSDRRAELDKRAGDLDMREQLLAAAEKKLDEREAALAALQAKIDAMVDEKQATEDAQFKGLVGMYETMKPKDAAKIFDTLEMPVLIRVARAMNPRKMAPILAAMSTAPAQTLSTALASPEAAAGTPATPDMSALPQIVGK